MSAKTVVTAAAERGVALEVDGFPDRQDLDVELLTMARDGGCWISLGTDAHHPDELDHLPYSLAAAIRAGVSRDRILNFLPLENLLSWAGARGAGHRPG